jgi:hypothetical protein
MTKGPRTDRADSPAKDAVDVASQQRVTGLSHYRPRRLCAAQGVRRAPGAEARQRRAEGKAQPVPACIRSPLAWQPRIRSQGHRALPNPEAVGPHGPGRNSRGRKQSCFRANRFGRIACAPRDRGERHPRWSPVGRLSGVSKGGPRVLPRAPLHCGRAAPEMSPDTAGFCCLNCEFRGSKQLNSCPNSSLRRGTASMVEAGRAEAAQ